MIFAPELQLPWYLVSLSMTRSDRVSIRLGVSSKIEMPGPLGRHGRDVLSYPTIYRDACEATFEFNGCLLVRICEEFSLPRNELGAFEGSTFRRSCDSALLQSQRECRPDVDALHHYQLVCPNEFIDIVCFRPPSISLRHFSNAPTA